MSDLKAAVDLWLSRQKQYKQTVNKNLFLVTIVLITIVEFITNVVFIFLSWSVCHSCIYQHFVFIATVVLNATVVFISIAIAAY